MKEETIDEEGRFIPSQRRLTKSGKVARAVSVDELPQLINVLKGEMSIVGPRPMIVKYFPYFTEEELRRHDVRPGITGLAQVRGRAFTDWTERFSYDIEYVANISPWLDIKILFETIITVFKKEGTSLKKPKSIFNFDVARKTVRNNEQLFDKKGNPIDMTKLDEF